MRGADDKPCWAFLSRLSLWVVGLLDENLMLGGG